MRTLRISSAVLALSLLGCSGAPSESEDTIPGAEPSGSPVVNPNGNGSAGGGGTSSDGGSLSHDGGSGGIDAGTTFRDGGTDNRDASVIPIGASVGIWSSPAELASKPMSGPAWSAILSAANGDTSHPNVSNQDDGTNVTVLAAAIVFARNGDVKYRTKVIAACQAVIGTEKGGRTLAWGREVGAYAMAADLVGYRTPQFEAWLRNVSDHELCSQNNVTLRQMFYNRPNNWGSMAFGSLTAIYRYLGDNTLLQNVRNYWVKGVEGPDPGYSWGDTSWQANASDPRIINPQGATKQGVNIDGLIPDDMRRGAGFTTGTPTATGYPWEHFQGMLMAAVVLDRAGLSIWNVGNKAIYRAAYALEVRVGGSFVASGDDLWQLAFLDRVYGTNWSSGQNVYGAGKNAGWAYVLR